MSVTPAMRDQVIALAAVVEAARLVDLLARTGSAPAAELKALTESLFFGDLAALETEVPAASWPHITCCASAASYRVTANGLQPSARDSPTSASNPSVSPPATRNFPPG